MGPGCCWEREHGGAAFPASVLTSPTKLPPHPDRNRSPHSALRAHSSQHTAPGLIPTPPCHPAQRALPSSVPPAPQLLPSPGTRLGLRLPGAGSGLPRWQLQEGSTGTLNQGGFPWGIGSPAGQEPQQRAQHTAASFICQRPPHHNSTRSVPGEQGRQRDGAFPHVPGQQSSRSPSFPVLSRGVTFISTSSGVLTVPVSEWWANRSAWVGRKEPKAGGKAPTQPC